MPKAKKNDTGANLGFEAKLWTAADKLRSNMDAAEYKQVVLGLIFRATDMIADCRAAGLPEPSVEQRAPLRRHAVARSADEGARGESCPQRAAGGGDRGPQGAGLSVERRAGGRGTRYVLVGRMPQK